MNNRRRLWSNLEGLQEANLLFVAWDGSDGNDLGIHCYSFPNNTNSLSKKIVKGFMTRLGCDGRPGSKGVVDACGRCGGDGKSCRGCDGVLSSGARLGKQHAHFSYKLVRFAKAVVLRLCVGC